MNWVWTLVNLNPGPAIVVPAQGAVQDRIHKWGLVTLVVQLVGRNGSQNPPL